MERKITITANDGNVFTGTNYMDLISEVNAYEADLKLKKEKEEAEKSEANKVFKEIEEMLKQVNAAVKEYELATGDQTYFATLNGELIIKKYSTLQNGLVKQFFGI